MQRESQYVVIFYCLIMLQRYMKPVGISALNVNGYLTSLFPSLWANFHTSQLQMQKMQRL